MAKTYTVQQLLKLYGSDLTRNAVILAEKSGSIPTPSRRASGSIQTRVWSGADLPKIGAKYGFLKKKERSRCLTVFTTKGGVLKTTLAVNIARMAALHDIRTCVVGLDLQGDITSALGFDANAESAEDMDTAVERVESTRGLSELFQRRANLADIIEPTDLPTLDLIPETADLAALDRAISAKAHREYWLRDNVVEPLRQQYDLIVLDCSPNWNQLISNALVSCDVLISPIECKINQFRNLRVFRQLTSEFKDELRLEYGHIYVPTRFASTRKLSSEIRSWYLSHLPGVTHGMIREATQGEESIATHLSVPEFAPTSLLGEEMRELIKELWRRMDDGQERRTDPQLQLPVAARG